MFLSVFYQSLKEKWFSPRSPVEADHSRQDRYLRSVALMHERLYQSRDLTRIDFSDHLRYLVQEVFNPIISEQGHVRVHAETQGVLMDIDTAILCGSLVHELVLVALRRASPAGPRGDIRVELGRDDKGRYRLNVQGLRPVRILSRSGTDMRLIEMLIDQLCGSMKMSGDGTTFYIVFTGPRS